MAPFHGLWNAMLLERFEWTETRPINLFKVQKYSKSIGAVNLLSSITKDGALEMKCYVEITALKTKNDSGVQTMKQSNKCVDKLSKDIGELLTDDDHCDVILVVQNQEIKVHKLILSARSPVFKAMLSVDMKEKRESRIVIPDIHFEAVKEFIKFLYSAQLNTTNYAKDLLILSEMYQIIDLKEACENKLLSQLNKDNAMESLFIANLYNCQPQLKSKAFDIIAK